MKIIEILSDKIAEEISDAKTYGKMALEYRERYPDLARTLYGLSLEEIEHMSRLHACVADIIDKYRAEKGNPPESMQAVYDYLHRKQIEKAAEVKNLQSLYKN